MLIVALPIVTIAVALTQTHGGFGAAILYAFLFPGEILTSLVCGAYFILSNRGSSANITRIALWLILSPLVMLIVWALLGAMLTGHGPDI